MAQFDPDSEFALFRQLAEALGESLEAVYNMQERERGELIIVLGLSRGGEDIGEENVASQDNKGQVQIEEDIVKLFNNDDSDNLVPDKDQFRYLSDSSDVSDTT